MTVDQVLRRAEELGLNPKMNGRGFACFCPAHGDTQTRHLYVSAGEKVQVLLNCRRGCGFLDVAQSMGLEARDTGAPPATRREGDLITHDYRDERGVLRYQTCRMGSGQGKKIWQRRPGNAPGEWINNLDGVEKILYRLPDLARSEPGSVVLIGEGEKVAEMLAQTGLPGTTNVNGAKAWRDDYAAWLVGRRVAIFRDEDRDGHEWAAAVLASLKSRSVPAVIVELPGLTFRENHGEDAHDWVRKHDHQPDELRERAETALEKEAPFVVNVVSVVNSPEYEAPRDVAEEAFYGLAGDIVRTLDPHTESAPIALLISFLIGIGNYIGRNPHYRIEGARHGTNLFGCLVGPTASARKGTATRRIDEILLCSINSNYTKNIVRGLSSGEGLVHHVRDPRIEQVAVKKAGRYTGEYDEVMVDQGVEDKRAMVREEEFASVLKMANREGNTLSVRLREAWDNVSMGSLTKGNKETATDPHISILGHITETELRRYLTDTEAGNGFANRFLWVCTHRSKFLPRGGGSPNLAPISYRIHEVVEIAQGLDRFEFDDQAGGIWDVIYRPLSAGKAGLLGAVTSRAETQVLRLCVLYAALDALPVIGLDHLLAALAVWDFCERSARYIFGEATGDDVADAIEEALRAVYPGFLTRTEIRDQFGRNLSAGRLPRALALLGREGRAQMVPVKTGGRPAEHWQCILRTGNDKNDINDKSPLEMARVLAREWTTKTT